MNDKNSFYLMRDESCIGGLNDLIKYINDIRPTNEMTMIEIGSYIGESTKIFCEHFKEVIPTLIITI